MPDLTIRPYRGDDEAALLRVWNRALCWDTVSASVFRRKVLLDPNFDPGLLLVAESDGALAGFCLGLVRRVPLEGVGLEPEHGWITAMGVEPDCRRQGIGSSLLDASLGLMTAAGRRRVAISPYAPSYFVPGIDVERHAGGVAFLQAHDFTTVTEAISMDASLVLLDLRWLDQREQALAQRGVTVRTLTWADVPGLMKLLGAHMYGDWQRHARDLLLDATRGLANIEQFTVAITGDEVVGYCQFEGEHFGPFGVRDDQQGKGIGTVVLGRCLETMRQHGHHNAWVLWTSDLNAEKVYSRFGFTITRRFAIMQREL